MMATSPGAEHDGLAVVGHDPGLAPHHGDQRERRLVLDPQRPRRVQDRAQQERPARPGTVEEAGERVHGRDCRRKHDGFERFSYGSSHAIWRFMAP